MATRYEHSVDPITTDGRDIDANSGLLLGEAAGQVASGSLSTDLAREASAWITLPESKLDDATYYDRPMLQRSVWTWAIPTYYFIGGLSGAAAVLAAALQISNREKHQQIIRRCHIIGLGGTVVSGALLIYDLGRPMRFLNMLRVFRPTSPMNVGAWILTFAGGASTGTVLLHRTFLARPFGVLAGLFGLGLSTYTGVLVANTAVPVWQGSRKTLPLLFGASAAASVGSVFDIVCESPVTRAFGNVGRLAELAGSVCMEREAGKIPYVARPLKRGFSGFLWRTASLLTASSLLISVLPRQNRGTRLAAGLSGTFGSLLLRFAVERAGVASARDPRATIRSQRELLP